MIKHDIHIHTHLSSCGDRFAFMADYIKEAKKIGLETLGFADHAWDDNIEGASDWYKPQTFKRLEQRREEIKQIDTEGINILLGAEGEYANMLLGISEEALEYTDYILAPHSHTHMKGFVLPDECGDNPEKHAKYLIDSFISLCGHKKRDLFFGIVHPMCPIGKHVIEITEIHSFISDEMILECAQAARESNVALELNISCARNFLKPDYREDNVYKRFLQACKKQGCKFFLGSDSHEINAFDYLHSFVPDALEVMGLEESDFTIEALRKPNA
ncbi:MAG: PHP domain-containing protein [Ruminococcaceae bacterium]|nr:PHP domain-containing protein [Oscillospiraceae bacterium]